MKLQAMVAKAMLTQAPIDHVQGRSLLRNEQNGLACCEAGSDHVGDGLAFAGSRWSDDDKIAALHSGQAGSDLRGIGRQWHDYICGGIVPVDVVFSREGFVCALE